MPSVTKMLLIKEKEGLEISAWYFWPMRQYFFLIAIVLLASPGFGQTPALLDTDFGADAAFALPSSERPLEAPATFSNSFVVSRPERVSSARKWWILSGVALTAATVADLATSVGRNEANPALRGPNGQFSVARGASIKISVTGATLLIQSLMTRRRPDLYRTSTVVNTIGAGAFAASAIYNQRIAH